MKMTLVLEAVCASACKQVSCSGNKCGGSEALAGVHEVIDMKEDAAVTNCDRYRLQSV